MYPSINARIHPTIHSLIHSANFYGVSTTSLVPHRILNSMRAYCTLAVLDAEFAKRNKAVSLKEFTAVGEGQESKHLVD